MSGRSERAVSDVSNGARVLELMASGYTLRQAADQIGLSKSQTHRIFQKELALASAQHQELRETVLHQELETLRLLLKTWMPIALEGEDAEAAGIVLRLSKQRADLLGLQAAVKLEVSNSRVDASTERILELLEANPTLAPAPLRRADDLAPDDPQDGDQ